MTYCPNAKKATVDYSFANKKGRFISDKAPVEVIEIHEGANFIGGQCDGVRYTLRHTVVSSTGSSTTLVGFWGPITDVRSVLVPNGTGSFTANHELYGRGFLPDPFTLGWWQVGRNFNMPADTTSRIDSLVREDNQLDNCGNPPPGKCTIKVIHNQQTLFSVSGSSPCSFTVACDDECPPGTTKCLTTNYPGYCCLPCKEIASEINAIANLVRSLNNG